MYFLKISENLFSVSKNPKYTEQKSEQTLRDKPYQFHVQYNIIKLPTTNTKKRIFKEARGKWFITYQKIWNNSNDNWFLFRHYGVQNELITFFKCWNKRIFNSEYYV